MCYTSTNSICDRRLTRIFAKEKLHVAGTSGLLLGLRFGTRSVIKGKQARTPFAAKRSSLSLTRNKSPFFPSIRCHHCISWSLRHNRKDNGRRKKGSTDPLFLSHSHFLLLVLVLRSSNQAPTCARTGTAMFLKQHMGKLRDRVVQTYWRRSRRGL